MIWQEIKEDFKRECGLSTYNGEFRKVFHAITSVGFQAVLGYRLSHGFYQWRIPFIPVLIQRMIELWAGVSISPQTKIGPGLVIYHYGGIVINSHAVLGSHCTLHHGVTIGNRVPGGPSPALGDRVSIGTGAVLLGGIAIGHDVEIGANAVVLDSIPEGAIAVGIPAKVVRTKGRS